MRHHTGFSLVELMVAVAIASLLLLVLVRFMTSGDVLSRRVVAQGQANETVRLQLKRMVKALREARYADTGAYPLVEMEPQRLIFYANVDEDAATERVRYELVGSSLERGVVEPTGEPLVYDLTTEQVSVVARSIRNGSEALFTYYGGDYPSDPTPLMPIDLTEVKYIQLRLVVDVDSDSDPPPLEVVSQVQLRNLKTNLGEVAG